MAISRSGIEIMNARTRNVSIARETIDIIKSGIYKSSSGAEVNISADIKAAVENSVFHESPVENNSQRTPIVPTIEVVNETTTSAARRLLSSGKANVVALNFAAAINVGGGFLGGANAQEEALCRASGLYECIRNKPMFYNRNILNDSPLYTDGIIYSPNVPFFRNDAHEFLDEPYKLSIITSPAPNISSLNSVNKTELESILMNRAVKILQVAEMHGHKNIILGAWGCGAFGNDPRVVASVFRAALEQVPAFESVCFAVYDTREPPVVYEAFRKKFERTPTEILRHYVYADKFGDSKKGRMHENHISVAGKILKKDGQDAAWQYIHAKCMHVDDLYDFQPPATASIIAQDRPFEQCPIYNANKNIQSYLYPLPKQQFSIPGENEDSHTAWFTKTDVDTAGFRNVKGLNKIFKAAKRVYNGVSVKVANRNKKRKAKLERENCRRQKKGLEPLPFEEENAFGEDGKLINPPGINLSILCYQNISPRPCGDLSDFPGIPHEYIGYKREPNQPINDQFIDRTAIPKGKPGYVPIWQRPMLSKKVRRRNHKWYSRHNLKPKKNRRATKYSAAQIAQASAQDALLCKIEIGDNWFILDIRGLLRNSRWRDLIAANDITIEEILSKFSGDPVINPTNGSITFRYKGEGIVPVKSEKITGYSKAPELLKKLSANEPIALISIDLGQTNPVSAKISRVSTVDGKLKAEEVSRQLLPKGMLDKLSAIREKDDEIEETMNANAIANLSPEHRAEFEKAIAGNTPEKGKERVESKYGIKASTLPWDEMSSHTTHIADAWLNNGGERSEVMFTPYEKKSVKKSSKPIYPIKRNDFEIYRQFIKLKVSKEASKAMFDEKWKLQRASGEYKKISLRKKEWSNEVVNLFEKNAIELTKCRRVVFNVEALTMDNRFASGSGKRERGWKEFFHSKKENRWMLQPLHKAFTSRPKHRGTHCIEVYPARTSMTCTECGYCHEKNRNGERFKCIRCGFEANADLDIATTNIERVALTGLAMPSPERSSAKKKPGIARKDKKSNEINEMTPEVRDELELISVIADIENDSARKAKGNAA